MKVDFGQKTAIKRDNAVADDGCFDKFLDENKPFFDSDMAEDNLSALSIGGLSKHYLLSYSIKKSVIDVNSENLSNRLRKPVGKYVTYDASSATVGARKYLVRQIGGCITKLACTQRKPSVLVVGLGNEDVVCDSLGSRVVEVINRDRRDNDKERISAFCVGVQGKTGISSFSLVGAVATAVKPDLIILVDSLATASAKRLGTSYQITDAGIRPSSGVQIDKPRLDRRSLGVPTIAIGVPLVLTLPALIKEFVEDYENSGDSVDGERFSATVSKKGLSHLVVSAKEVGYTVAVCADIIAKAIIFAFS